MVTDGDVKSQKCEETNSPALGMEPQCPMASVRLLAAVLNAAILYSSRLDKKSVFEASCTGSPGVLFLTKQNKTALSRAQLRPVQSAPPAVGPQALMFSQKFSIGDFNVQLDGTSTALKLGQDLRAGFPGQLQQHPGTC